MASNIDVTVKGVESLDKAANAIDRGAKSTASLRGQVKALNQELATMDPNSEKFQELAAKAGGLKDQLNDASEAVRANAGPAFETLGNNASLLTQRLGNLDFEGVSQSVKGMAGSISKVSFKELIGGIKGFGASLQALGKALLANPIFLLVAALVAIGAAIKGLLDEQRNQVDKANEAIDKSNEKRHLAEKKRLAEAGGDVQKQYELKREFAKKDIEATEKQIANLERMARSQYGLSEEQETKLDELRKKNAEQRVDYEIMAIEQLNQLNAERVAIQTRYENIGLSQRELSQKQIEANYKKEVERLVALGATTEELYKVDAYYEDELNKLSAANAKEDSDRKKAASEQYKAQLEKEREARIAANEAERELANELLKTKQEIEKELAAEQLRITENRIATEKELEAQEIKFKEEQAQLRLELNTSEIEAEINAVDQKYIELRRLAHGDAELNKQLAEQNAKEVQAIEEKYAKSTRDTKINLAQGAVDALMALNDALQNGSEKSAKRAFVVNKALSLAQALTNTYLGANAAFAQTVGGIGIKIAAASVATVSGLANVAKIAKTKFNAGGGDSGGSSGGGGGASAPSFSSNESAATAPSFSAFNGSFLNNRPSQQAAPVQAYVLESNVSNSLEAVTKIKDKARL